VQAQPTPRLQLRPRWRRRPPPRQSLRVGHASRPPACGCGAEGTRAEPCAVREAHRPNHGDGVRCRAESFDWWLGDLPPSESTARGVANCAPLEVRPIEWGLVRTSSVWEDGGHVSFWTANQGHADGHADDTGASQLAERHCCITSASASGSGPRDHRAGFCQQECWRVRARRCLLAIERGFQLPSLPWLLAHVGDVGRAFLCHWSGVVLER